MLSVHTLSSLIGDLSGDWIHQFQRGTDSEKEDEWLLTEIIANKIEDSIKAAFIVICYGNTLVIKILERFYYCRQTLESQQQGQYSGLYKLTMGTLIAYDSYQFFERYNWINEIADAIADMFTDLF